jgi:hypothetical protein
MKHRFFLRIAAILMLVHFLGHTFGHFQWEKTPDAGAQEVIQVMKAYSFPFMGVERSMADHYVGFSWFVTVTLALCVVWLWILASRPAFDRPLAWTLVVLLLSFGVLELVYFFPFAVGMSWAAAVCVLMPLVRKPA